jgi:hypothetical protein
MNSDPLSESIPQDRERETPHNVLEASKTHLAAVFRTDRFTVHPVAISVTLNVKQNPPEAKPPSWPTRSTSTNPGTASPQSAQGRIGIWDSTTNLGV